MSYLQDVTAPIHHLSRMALIKFKFEGLKTTHFSLRTLTNSSALGGCIVGCATNRVTTLYWLSACETEWSIFPSKTFMYSTTLAVCLFFHPPPSWCGKIWRRFPPPPGYETSLMHYIFIHRCFIQERCSTGPTYLICYVSRSVYTHASLHDSALQKSVWTFHLMCLAPKRQQWSLWSRCDLF